MKENLDSKVENSRIKEDANDEIDLRLILNLLLRNSAVIGLISTITVFFGILYSFTLKEVWKGQFQIVLNKGNKAIDVNPQLANTALFNFRKENELDTEVEILKSPSVLMPVFEFAKSQNDQIPSSFSSWKKTNLNIALEKNTSILNISYKNENKKTIIPVLNEMSSSYQEYSGKNKRRSQELTNNFLNEQISIFKEKSANSLKVAQEYALDQDLLFYNSPKDLSDNASLKATNLLLSNIGIENVRVQAANQIRKINLQLKKIKELNDSSELQYFGSTIPTLVEEGLPKVLRDIEADLLKARSIYTDKDIAIKNLINERKLAIDLLKNRTIKYLEAEKLNSEATLEAAMRPKGVILKYKELIREAARDEKTLIQLEDKLNLFKLDLASQEDPWELITKPTLLENRVSPIRKRIALNSLIIGLILGIAYSIFKEKRSGNIYESSEIEKLIPIKLISKINLSKIEFENQKLYFVRDFLSKASNNFVNFVPIGNIETQELDEFKVSLINKKFSKDFEISFNKDSLKKYSNFLILKLGYVKYTDILILRKRLNLIENNFNGLIILY